MSNFNLGKPKPHSAKEIRERREKVLILMSKGYNQSDIAKDNSFNGRPNRQTDREGREDIQRNNVKDLDISNSPYFFLYCISASLTHFVIQ